MNLKKKRYLFLMKSNTWGGAERRMASYCANVDHSACSITWAVLEDKFSARFAVQNTPISVVEFPRECRKDGQMKNLPLFYRFVSEQRPDVVIASNFWLKNFSFWEMMILVAVTRGKVFMVVHDCPPVGAPSRLHWGIIPGIGLSWRMDWLKAYMLSLVPCPMLAIYDPVKQHLVRNYSFSEKKVHALRFGVDLEHFKPSAENRREIRRRYHIEDRDTVIVSTARLHKVKRLERLLKAFAVAAKYSDDRWLIMVGEGQEYAALSALARSFEERVQKRIIFTGFVDDVAPFLQAGDIFVLPSETEGFSNACVEAMACKLVVIVTRCIGPEAYLTNGINGFLVENSARGVTEGLQDALRLSDVQREMMGACARSYVEKNFDRSGGIDEFLSLTGLSHNRSAEVAVPVRAAAFTAFRNGLPPS